jgi:hypothetical protein
LPELPPIHLHLQGVVSQGRARTRYVTVPADVATDSLFPFEEGGEVTVTIDKGRLVIEKEDGRPE